MSQVSSTRKLLSAGALMASGTMISRVLGMLRVVLIAFILGNGTRQADILGIATMVPNALYILFAGGALNTVLVPQIVRAIKNDEDGGEAYTNRIMTAFMLVVGVVAIVATAAAPLITSIYSDSAWRQPELAEQYASMVALTYLTLPQIFFYGAFFLLAQVLNARDRFGPMMWAPIANNVISIIVLGTYFLVWGNQGDKSGAFTTGQILLLGIGSTLGIVSQTLVLIPFLRKVGFRFRPRFDLKGTGLGHTFSLTKWTLGFVAVNQLALVVVNRLATTATAGGEGAGVNVYSNAHLLWILPHSLVTTSLATAMLPNASRLAASHDMRGVAQEMTKTVRLALIFIVPATAMFLALADPTVNALFGHGQGSSDADWVGWALMAFAVGLIPFTVQFVCLRTFYAMEDTRTPFLLQIGIATINAGGALLLVWLVDDPTLVATALAASYSLAYLVGVFGSWQLLRRRLPGLRGVEIGMHLVRLSLGAAPGAVAAWLLWRLIDGRLPGSFWGQLLAIAVGGALILGSTLGIGKLLQIREMRSLSQLLRRRRGSGAPADSSDEPSLPSADPRGGSGSASAELAMDQTAVAPRVDDEESGLERPDFDDDPPTTIRPRPALPGEFAHEDLYREEPLPPEEPSFMESIFADPTEHSLDEESDLHRSDFDVAAADYGYELPQHHHVDDRSDTVALPGIAPIGEPGMVLGVRYQLMRRLARRRNSETWLAHDQVLSRDVVAHVMAAGEADSEALLGAARRGAAATDSRFLRILDVDRLDDGGPIGVYVVCEYSPGKTLTELLRGGALSAADGAFIGREVAEALSPMHDQGLFHERLDPDHVLITPGGGVRVTGFGVEAALQGGHSERPWSRREADDVVALATILRATQTGEWDESLDPADGYPLAGVWQAAFAGRIATMADLANALPDDDASATLEAKMALSGRTAATPPTVASAPAAQQAAEPPAPARAEVRLPGQAPRKPRFVLWVLVILALISLIVSLVAAGMNNGMREQDEAAPSTPSAPGSSRPASESPTPQGDPGPLEIAAVSDFDPEADGGNDEEYPDNVARVVDGDPETTWQTMRYLNRPDLGGLKPGVGIIVDLGQTRTVSSVDVAFVGGGATMVELRAPKGDEPSTATVDDWDVVAANRSATGDTQIAPDAQLETRHVLVYLTELPPVDGGFRSEISEITVQGW